MITEVIFESPITEVVELVVSTTEIETLTQGPAGPSGENFTVQVASMSLSGHRAVTTGLVYADKDTLAHAFAVLGITRNAVGASGSVQVQYGGAMIEPSWSWTPNLPIFLGSNGVLTQVAPTTGFILSLGFALSATEIMINISIPIFNG